MDLEALAAESAVTKERSHQLIELLDNSHPKVDRSQLKEVLAESRRLARATHRARGVVAARWIAGADAGVPIGHQPPIRRIKTDARGRDADPLGGRAAVTPELIAYWEHRRDVVFPATEGMYRAAAERTPYQEALAAAARGHISLLRERRTMLSEGGDKLEAALGRYDTVYLNLRANAIDSQDIASEAVGRLASLKREAAAAELGDGPDEKGFIGAVLSTMSDLPVDPETALPLVPAPTSTPVTGARSTQVRSNRQPPSSSTALTYGGSERRKTSGRTSSWRSGATPAESRVAAGSSPSSDAYDDAALRWLPLETRAGTEFS
jgi:hypothetical protein